MTNFKMLAPTGAIIRKLGVKQLIEKMGNIDVEQKDAQEQFGKEMFGVIAENLEEISGDIIDLCAAYKKVPREEMENRSPFVEIKELFADEDFGGFFKSVLALAQKHD